MEEFIKENLAGIIVMLGMLFEIAPIKINPITFTGKKLGVILNGCDLNEELKKINEKVDRNDIATIKNRILALEMLIRNNQNISECQYKAVFKDIDKWECYHKIYNDLNGELKNAIDNIFKNYNKS